MWVFLKDGFVSIVEHKTDKELLVVRGRRKEDVYNFFLGDVPEDDIVFTEKSDYQYRYSDRRDGIILYLGNHVLDIDYTNFKKSIDPLDFEYRDATSAIWSETVKKLDSRPSDIFWAHMSIPKDKF